MIRLIVCLSLLVCSSQRVTAALLEIASQDLFVHRGQPSPDYFNAGSPEYTSALDGNGFGSYSWLIPNTSGSTWTNFVMVFFLDVAWDIGLNLASNEYADFLGFGLPVGAPPGAIAFSIWEADEPGYVFGDIYTNASVLGTLDNTNAVPSGAPDDVSLAIAFVLAGPVAPGDSVRITIFHLTGASNGLAHFDPDSAAALYVNGYAEILSSSPAVPEPSSYGLALAGLAAWAVSASRKKGV